MTAYFDYSQDEPPVVPEAKGHPPRRARLINFVGLRDKVQDSIAADTESLHKVDRIIAEPAQDERTLGEIVKTESSRLLEFIGFLPKGTCEEKESVARDVVEKRLAANRRAAETATAARPEVVRRIAIKQSQLDELNKREGEFLFPAILEMLENSSIPQEYMRRIQSLREIMQLIFSAGEMLSGHGCGRWGRIEHMISEHNPHDTWHPVIKEVPGIKMPRAGVSNLKLVPESAFEIKLGDENPWHAIAEKLLASPAEPVALPPLASAA
jgi:hypothetical protein